MRPPDADWWDDELCLRRFVGDLLAAELARLRPRPAWPPAGVRPADALDVDLDTVWLDSLDLLQLSVTLSAALELSPSGALDLAGPVRRLADWLPICRQALTRSGRRITFRSSGSTGVGQAYSHGLAELEQEAELLSGLLPARTRVLNSAPAHHLDGFLFSILLPRTAGGLPVLDCPSPLSMSAVWQPGDLVVAYPEFWQACAALAPTTPTDVLGVTSTAPCPAAVSIALAARGLPLIEIFGASETAGLGWRRDPDAPFTAFPWWRVGADDTVERLLPDGRRVRHRLADRLDWRDDGHFVPAGRLDAQVQIGGINVSPAEVRRKLLAHPWIADAAVRLMRPDEGQRLKAAVVASGAAPEGAAWLPDLERWIVATLPAAERPTALRIVDALPTGALGKAADWDA